MTEDFASNNSMVSRIKGCLCFSIYAFISTVLRHLFLQASQKVGLKLLEEARFSESRTAGARVSKEEPKPEAIVSESRTAEAIVSEEELIS